MITWNLFHGRDFPPEPELLTRRSRLTGRTEPGSSHVQVNRDLLDAFAAVIAASPWDIALLQECPPRFASPLAAAANAEQSRALTARNWALPLTQRIAASNPDLIASWEGGANVTLVRGQAIAAERRVVLTRLPERRVLLLVRLASGLCVANLHANGARGRAEAEVRTAALAACEFAAGAPLVFGGDLNLRPSETGLFDDLHRELGFAPLPAGDAIDHLLARNMDVVEEPSPWPVEAREFAEREGRVRLSDHTPVEAVFAAVRIG